MTTELILECATNKWEQMTTNERRVALAKDVLQLLTAERIAAESGNYFRVIVPGAKPSDDARDVIMSLPKCEVCAKGGLLLAKIYGRDAIPLQAIGADDEPYKGNLSIETRSRHCEAALSDTFDADTLHRIEAAFEGEFVKYPSDVYEDDEDEDEDEDEDPSCWVEKYATDHDRLCAIMQRVIDNCGSFTAHDLDNP